MKKLSQVNFENLKLSGLQNIKGGDGSTHYETSRGRSGTDCYSDDDGDGKLSKGDGILLDTGLWLEK